MDIFLNKVVQFYLNNMINLRHLTQRIKRCYTHKMAIVSWQRTAWRLCIDSKQRPATLVCDVSWSLQWRPFIHKISRCAIDWIAPHFVTAVICMYAHCRAIFLPARRYARSGTSYCPVSFRLCLCPCLSLSQVGVLSKRLNESSWFWTQRLCSVIVWGNSGISKNKRPSLWNFAPNFENFATASSKRAINLARQRRTLRAWYTRPSSVSWQ